MGDAQRLRVGWSEQQWAAIDAAVASDVMRGRVVEHIISTTKVGANDKAVAIDRINRLMGTIDDVPTMPLPEISINLYLDRQQVQQPELTRALALVRRAASDFARIEDEVFLRGIEFFAGAYRPDGRPLQQRFRIERGQDRARYDGLAGSSRNVVLSQGRLHRVRTPRLGQQDYGPLIVKAVPRAIGILEEVGHMGPYHLILGERAFVAALTPNAPALILPKDRIEPLLASPIRRSPALDPDEGVLVSTGGDPTDRVVAVEPTLRFVDTTAQDTYQFRVYGVLALRRKEPEAVVQLLFPP